MAGLSTSFCCDFLKGVARRSFAELPPVVTPTATFSSGFLDGFSRFVELAGSSAHLSWEACNGLTAWLSHCSHDFHSHSKPRSYKHHATFLTRRGRPRKQRHSCLLQAGLLTQTAQGLRTRWPARAGPWLLFGAAGVGRSGGNTKRLHPPRQEPTEDTHKRPQNDHRDGDETKRTA